MESVDGGGPQYGSAQPIQQIGDNGAANDQPPGRAFEIPDARLAVGTKTNLAELQSLVAAYAAERNFRCTMHYSKKKECITWQCERGGLSEKEMRLRRQCGDFPLKRKSPNKSEAIVINEEEDRKTQKPVKSRKRISLKCGCKFKVYAHSCENDVWEIRTSALQHTNGCVPSPAFAAACARARGLKLDAATVASLQDDVVTMKLSSAQIMAKLRKVGVILEPRQARNLRYRFMKGLPVGPKNKDTLSATVAAPVDSGQTTNIATYEAAGRRRLASPDYAGIFTGIF